MFLLVHRDSSVKLYCIIRYNRRSVDVENNCLPKIADPFLFQKYVSRKRIDLSWLCTYMYIYGSPCTYCTVLYCTTTTTTTAFCHLPDAVLYTVLVWLYAVKLCTHGRWTTKLISFQLSMTHTFTYWQAGTTKNATYFTSGSACIQYNVHIMIRPIIVQYVADSVHIKCSWSKLLHTTRVPIKVSTNKTSLRASSRILNALWIRIKRNSYSKKVQLLS